MPTDTTNYYVQLELQLKETINIYIFGTTILLRNISAICAK